MMGLQSRWKKLFGNFFLLERSEYVLTSFIEDWRKGPCIRLASRAFERILIPHWLKYSHFVFDGTCVVSVLGACKFRGYKSVYCVPVIYRAETCFEKYKELPVGRPTLSSMKNIIILYKFTVRPTLLSVQ